MRATLAALAVLVGVTTAGAQVAPAKPTATADASVKIESTIMSWAAMNSVAEAIAAAVDDSLPTTASCVIVVGTPDAVTDANVHRMLMNELAELQRGYEGITVTRGPADVETAERKTIEALTGQVDLVSKLLNSVLGIVTLFRTDKTLEGVAITPDDEALAALVAGKLTPRSECGRAQMLSLSGGAKLMKALMDVQSARRAKLAAADTPTFKSLDARLDSVLKVLMAEDPKTKRPAAGRLGLAERLAEAKAGTLVLHVHPVAMGGTNLEKTGFFVANSVSHSGGGVASFVLARTDGAVLASDTFWSYDGYAKNPTSRSVDASAFQRPAKPKTEGKAQPRR